MKTHAFANALCLSLILFIPSLASAADSATVIDYRVGGGNPILDSPGGTEVGLGGNTGVSWNNDLTCTDFNMDDSLKASFDSGEVKRMQAQVIGYLKSVFNPVGLIGNTIRRADPGLYEMIMNGAHEVKSDFGAKLASCEKAQEAIVDLIPGGSMRNIAASEKWADFSKQAQRSSFDLVGGTDLTGVGDEGIQVGTQKKGGVGQPPVKAIEDTSQFGFNVLTGRDVEDNSNLSSVGRKEAGIAQVFNSPAELKHFLVRTVGESAMRTCEGCAPIVSTPGQGAKATLDKERDRLKKDMRTVLEKPQRTITASDLAGISAGKSVPVTKDIIIELKKMPAAVRSSYVDNLVTDIAMARVVDKLIYARQALATGRQESSLSANDAVQGETERKIHALDSEMDSLEREMRIKRFAAKNTAIAILERESRTSESMLIDSRRKNVRLDTVQ